MEDVIKEGTGRLAFKDMPFQVAGKTGTAHVADGPIGYNDRVYQASFVGYFPADNPQYSCIVVIRTKPHAYLHYGGQLAAPVFREIATKLYSKYVSDLKPNFSVDEADSTAYIFKGSAGNIKYVYQNLNLGYRDSALNDGWAAIDRQYGEPVIRTVQVNKGVMPDLKGFGLKDALYLLEQSGIEAEISGRGKIATQSIEAGAVIKKGMVVKLELK